MKVVPSETLTFEFRIVNEGVRDAGPFSVEVSASGLIFGEEIEFLEAGGSIPKVVEVGDLAQGHHEVSAEVIFPADQDRSNNRYSRDVIVGAQPRRVVSVDRSSNRVYTFCTWKPLPRTDGFIGREHLL